MKFAKDFRASARDALKGKWGIAVGAGFVASIFGAGGGASFSFDLDDDPDVSGGSENFDEIAQVIEKYLPVVLGMILAAVLVGVVIGIAWSVLASTVNVGYCRFNLDLVDGKTGSVNTLFSYFPFFWKAFVTEFLRNLYIFLWTLLFIIPGIIATYNYALVPYIIAEDTQISSSDALRRSKKLMYGNRWRLFCLELSFIGWHFLAMLTLGIGELWVKPYVSAAIADFYREISDTRPKTEFESESDYTDITEQVTEF